jgi:hypothetical protein
MAGIHHGWQRGGIGVVLERTMAYSRHPRTLTMVRLALDAVAQVDD